MTAPNNPTPEVEAKGVHTAHTPTPELERLLDETAAELYAAKSDLERVTAERDEAAATIARLTAERDDYKSDYLRVHSDKMDLFEKLIAAEKRVKELERSLSGLDKLCVIYRKYASDKSNQHIEMTRANKLLSERIAVLEKELAFADKQTSLIEEALDPHIKWEPMK